MPKKEVIQVNLAAANPNLSPATPVWQSGLRGRADGETPGFGGSRKGVREQTHYALQRVNTILGSRRHIPR